MSGLMPPGPLSYEGQVVVPYITRSFSPTTKDFNFGVPTIWINFAASLAYILVAKPQNVADWILFASGSGNVVFLEGNTGGPVGPNGPGVINVIGDGTTITVAGNPGTNTLTISLVGGHSAIEEFLPDSGTSPVVPNASGQVTMAGSTNITTVGGTNSITFNLQGITQYNVLSGGAGNTLNNIPPSATTGWVLASNGSAVQSSFQSLSSLGSLLTLSDDVNSTITPSSGNIQLVGHVVEQGATKFSTVVAGTHLANINPMSSARWIVDPLGFNGTHTTIASAITSATSGDTIFLLPGTYTENPTLKAGVNLAAYECDASTPNVTIVGKCTMTTAGTVTISGVNLQTNSDFLLAVTGSAASVVNLVSCNLNITNNTGISHTSSSSSSSISLFNCQGNIGTTGITAFVSTSAGNMSFKDCYITNSGASTTASSVSTAVVTFFNGLIGFCGSTSSVGSFVTDHCSWNPGVNATCLTTAGTGGSTCQFTEFQSGTASAISIGAGTTLNASHCNISSTNTNAIAGAGSLIYQGLSFPNTSSQVQNTLSLTLRGASPSNATSGFVWTSTGTNTSPTWQAVSVPTFSVNIQKFTSNGTYTPTSGMAYCTIEVVGGGGGGGGCAQAGASAASAGGGGGGGGYAKGVFSAATIGVSQSVTIGAAGAAGTAGNNAGGTGGTTSVGALISATGGVGGSGAAAGSAGSAGVGGAGTGGSFQTNGTPGIAGNVFYTATAQKNTQGSGGSSFFGGGAQGDSTASGTGRTAASFGGGGAGGGDLNSANQAGGAGFAGLAVVTEFII